MARRNRRQRANDRRRKMKPHESEPELGSDDQSELSHEDSNPPLDTHEAQVSQLQNMRSQIEIKVETPISNALNHLIARRIRANLYKAALRGDWKDAERALRSDVNIARTGITDRGDTALHVAATAKQTAFVRKLVEKMEPIDLEIKDIYGNTPFCLAAVSGVVEIAKVMYDKNYKLPTIRSSRDKTPLQMAIWHNKGNMAEYLYTITPFKDLNEEEIKEIFLETVHADMYDISLMMLVAVVSTSCLTSSKIGESVLRHLARQPLPDIHSIRGRIWERFVSIIATIPYIPYFKSIYTSLQMRRQASLLVIWLWNFDEEKHSLCHVAVINRLQEVVRLIYHTGVIRKEEILLFIDDEGNNILHLAGKLAPPSRLNIASGAALQMQKELQWFKAMEKIVLPSFVRMENEQHQTPRELFTKEHEELRNVGEKWMKDTATSCMVVATLIATVVFAAAFTVPGGYKEQNGAPIFLNDEWFTVFVISDALAMYSSTASILTCLSLFTAQYREDDFLFSLPTKLMIGLFTLFASIVCMVLTFTATFFLVYKEENQGTLPKYVAAFAGLPIALYALLNCRLWISLIHSTFFTSRFTFKSGKIKLF